MPGASDVTEFRFSQAQWDFWTATDRYVSYSHQIFLTPNPPHHDHWLAREFLEDNSHADHRYIRTTVYDNRVALGEAYIQALEAACPAGSVLRGRFVEGLRGLHEY